MTSCFTFKSAQETFNPIVSTKIYYCHLNKVEKDGQSI